MKLAKSEGVPFACVLRYITKTSSHNPFIDASVEAVVPLIGDDRDAIGHGPYYNSQPTRFNLVDFYAQSAVYGEDGKLVT